MTTPSATLQSLDAQALYMRQRAAELHLWGAQHTATAPPWSDLSPAEQADWCAIAAREREGA